MEHLVLEFLGNEPFNPIRRYSVNPNPPLNPNPQVNPPLNPNPQVNGGPPLNDDAIPVRRNQENQMPRHHRRIDNVIVSRRLLKDFLDYSDNVMNEIRPLTVLLLLESEGDCNKLKTVFELVSRCHGQPVSLVYFTRVRDALIYMGLDFSLTTNVYHYDAVNRIEMVTKQLRIQQQLQLQLIPEVIVVDESMRQHPDFDRLILDVFSHRKLMILSGDQSLALRELDVLDPFGGFEAIPRPFSTSRWRRIERSAVGADVVCNALREVLRKLILDIDDCVERGAALIV